jgi:threonine dehydrogenase-like Zn-dependent dehydrogenase
MSDIPKSCKAAVLVEYGKPDVIQEVAIPEVGHGGILVKVLLAGVCGTDVHQHLGDLNIKPPLPNIQGHETLARIVKLGEGRNTDVAGTPLKLGDRIMWAHAFCGECYYCKIHRKPYMCVASKGYGFAPPEALRGGFAEYVLIDGKTEVVRVPDEVLDEEALGVGCALRSVVSGFERLQRHSPIGIADNVVIQGCGPIGLYATLLASRSGAGKIIVIGAPASRLELAKEWGATDTINLDEVTEHNARVEIVKELTGGLGAKFAIEGTGFPAAFDQGFDFLRKDSTYLVLGQTSDATITFAPGKVMQKQCIVIGNGSADIRHFYKALKFIQAYRNSVDFSKLITTKYTLENVNEALDSMQKGRDIKAAIDFRGR